MKDGLEEIGSMAGTITKASKLVSFVRQSSLASDSLQGESRLQANNCTRWNSTVKMSKSILSVDPVKLELLDYNAKLTAYEMKLDFLAPFEAATDQCQGQKILTSSMIIPCIRGLRAEVKKLSST